ncbi:hypothetical protein GCM10009687_21420 [Asanoa iriomotensis]|uniref:Uncharacterized protein n=1 Tax=Asanoa iriomotensis TaxID=234613 RepID=A0ABQ4CA38_9ACTN|nr:hypothetical protein Air01nite_57400 [Asanoa iriomotensis]
MGADPAPGPQRSEIEAALRYLGTRTHELPVDLLQHAVERPGSPIGTRLSALTSPTKHLDGWTAAQLAHALWQVIREGIRDPDVSPAHLSRRRRVLQAAFRLPDSDIHEPWGSSLTERFTQLVPLVHVFGRPTTTQPMEAAWKRAVHLLAAHLEGRFAALAQPTDWDEYRRVAYPSGVEREGRLDEIQAQVDSFGYNEALLREPSSGAQPIFINLFITTVFMKRRAVYRRITERLITARTDDVAYYTARGFAGKPPRLTYVPVKALWGCDAEFVESSRPGRPAVTRLWFPKPLRAGEQAHFASEIVDENITEERQWIDVDVDHHGIAKGALVHGGRLPISGLTIRVRFDDNDLPEAVWWYAELNESERYDRPPPGHRRLLSLAGNDVSHTFTDRYGQPRESYGIAFSWPT